MSCGELRLAPESHWRICTLDWQYRSGSRTYRLKFRYPCRKQYQTLKYCYDFAIVTRRCLGLFDHVTGCCDGREYSTIVKCVGFRKADRMSSRTICFYSRLGSRGPCSDMSRAALTAPASAVKPRSALQQAIFRKLGSCRRCMRQASVLTAAAWLPLLASDRPRGIVPRVALESFAAALSGLLIAHGMAFIAKSWRGRRSDCGCAEADESANGESGFSISQGAAKDHTDKTQGRTGQ
jgi:hypothetical protein